MKTIAPKDAFRLFLFMLILLSAKTFSHPRLPNAGNPGECGSRIGNVKKTTNNKAATSHTYSSVSKGNVVQSKNNVALKSNATSKRSLKVAVADND